jgi:hypothetical protein
MARHALQIDDLATGGSDLSEHFRFRSASVAVEQNDTMSHRGLHGVVHHAPPRLVATCHHTHPPTDLRQNGSERARALAAPPAVYHRPPRFTVIGERAFDVSGGIARNESSAHSSRLKSALLLVDAADARARRRARAS